MEEATERLRRLTREEWKAIQAEGGEVTASLAALQGRAPDDADMQQAIARHHAWIEHFYPAPTDRYRGLAQIYAEHPGLRAFYDGVCPGMADFMRAAMEVYAESALT